MPKFEFDDKDDVKIPTEINEDIEGPEEGFDLELEAVLDGIATGDEEEVEADEKADTESEKEAEEADGQEDGEDDERKTFGRRAERRIRSLVRDKKILSSELEARERRLEEAEARLARLEKQSVSNEEHAITQHEERIKETEERLKNEFKTAYEAGDQDRLWNVQENLATIKAERLALEQYKMQRPVEEADDDVEEIPSRQDQPEIDPMAQRWYTRNRWFGQDEELSEVALDIHRELLEDGFDPTEQASEGNRFNDYYIELDKRLHTEYPEKFQTETPKKRQRVASGTRTGRRSNKISLSSSEMATANRLGIDPKEYAKQKLRIQRRTGE